MLGIAIHCIQHSQAMLERGVCELAHSFFDFPTIVCLTFDVVLKINCYSLQAFPHKRVRGIIGLGSNTLTEKLAPVLLSNKIPQISSREDQYEFNDKVYFYW